MPRKTKTWFRLPLKGANPHDTLFLFLLSWYRTLHFWYKGPCLLDAVDSVKSQDLNQGTVRSLERGSQGCTIARAGDNVAIALQENDANQVMSGVFCGNPKEMDQTDLRGECVSWESIS
ncbi:hypothetical protein DY000_02000001 [Brassica cretica]|uniref:Uncharacterized protein n=1 Tax=Brassica cretica TaxID=69181 RepID=A0ABQ7CAM0_BRACR|nr:hypothetical protein DY000_02000001 [Brassica cretica]